MADDDLIKLYSKRILALAASLSHTDRLADPDGSAKERSPLCGSVVQVDIALGPDGRIAKYGQDVKACALGQASASAIAAVIEGKSREEVQAGRDALRAMLKTDAPAPEAPWDALEAMLPAKDYKNRHASIMLTFEAILAAFEDAREKTSA